MVRSISIRGLRSQASDSGGSSVPSSTATQSGDCAETPSRGQISGRGQVSGRRRSESGFTLIELMIVMAIIGILSAIAIPSFIRSVQKAKEAALKEDLHTMRTAIDSYTVDKEQAPQSLDDLVQAGYMKVIPIDPMTNRNDTWITSESDTLTDLSQTQGGLDDVHSGAQGVASDGTTYNTW